MIDFALIPSTGEIKIGTTKDLGGRMAHYRTRYGEPLTLLAVLPGSAEIQHQARHGAPE